MRYLASILFCFASISMVVAQARAPIYNFEPKDFAGANQNWDVSESLDGTVYVANNTGLLAYNGVRWKLYRQPNEGLIRSVLSVGELVYTGGYKDFGFWEKDSQGMLQYTSALDLLPTDFYLGDDEQIWNIIKFQETIIFQSLEHLFIYEPSLKKMVIKDFGGIIADVKVVDGGFYIHIQGKGVYHYQRGNYSLVSTDEFFRQNWIVDFYEMENDFVVITRRRGIYKVSKDFKTFEPYKNTPEARLYCSVKEGDKLYIGSVAEGLFVYDLRSQTYENFCENDGLLNNTILSIDQSLQGNIWLGLDYGLSLMNYGADFWVYDKHDQAIGTVYAAKYYRDNLFIGTNQGLYKFHKASQTFKMIPGSDGQVWCIKAVDSGLLIGHDKGSLLFQNGVLNSVSSEPGTWNFQELGSGYVQGNYIGVHYLNNNLDYLGKFDGIDFSARKMKVFQGYLWIDHPDKSYLLGYELDTSSMKATLRKQISKGRKSINSNIHVFDGKLYYLDERGFSFLDLENERLVLDSNLNKYFDQQDYISGSMFTNENHDLWYFTDNNINQIHKTNFQNEFQIKSFYIKDDAKRSLPGFEVVDFGDGNEFLIGSVDSFLVYNAASKDVKVLPVRIDEVTVFNRQEASSITMSLKNPSLINYSFNNIRFDLAIPNYGGAMSTNYSYRLRGYSSSWSELVSFPFLEFNNLPFGSYTLEVKTLSNSEQIGSVLSYDFEINRPSYLSRPALVTYVVLIFAFLFGISLLNKFYYRKQQRLAIERNKQEMELQTLETSKKLAELKNEKLKNEIESKNKEISITAMSVSRKNHALNLVKNEVEGLKESQHKKEVLKIIEKNINSSEDWELVKATINGIDSQFLKRIQNSHPNLTHNDLKFCGYLRMNLTSKEIAPLLNISIKSVEIKRYRLRKKLQIEHSVNLTDYILSI